MNTTVYIAGVPPLPAAARPAGQRRRRTRAAGPRTTTSSRHRRRPARVGRCRRARRGPVPTSRCSFRGRWARARSTGRPSAPSSSARTPTCPPRTPPCRSSRPYERNWTDSLRRTPTRPGDSYYIHASMRRRSVHPLLLLLLYIIAIDRRTRARIHIILPIYIIMLVRCGLIHLDCTRSTDPSRRRRLRHTQRRRWFIAARSMIIIRLLLILYYYL